MKELIVFIITFIAVYLIYFLFVISRKKTLIRWQNGKEMSYLKKVYKINIKPDNIKPLANLIALTNSFIVALTLSIISFLNNFIIQMLLGFIILSILILISYHLIGKYYQNKKGKK